jgi:hypothetical protein
MDGSIVALGVLCVVTVTLTVVLVVVAGTVRRRRRERWRFEVRGWAKRHGWQVLFDPHADWTDRLPGRNSRGVSMLLVGTIGGRQVGVANYSYTTTSTSTSTDANGHMTTTTTTDNHDEIVALVWVRTPTPAVTLHQRGAISRLGRRIFGDSATATGHAEFDRRFRIESYPPDAARALFGPALMAEHLANLLPLWSLYNGVLLAHRPGEIEDPASAPAMVAPLVRVADLLGR